MIVSSTLVGRCTVVVGTPLASGEDVGVVAWNFFFSRNIEKAT